MQNEIMLNSIKNFIAPPSIIENQDFIDACDQLGPFMYESGIEDLDMCYDFVCEASGVSFAHDTKAWEYFCDTYESMDTILK